MRRLLPILMLLALTTGAAAQDSAEAVVQRYLRLLAYERLPADSMLALETTVTFLGSTDTFVMRRYYQAEGMLRVEVRRGDTLTTGFCTNGTTRYRQYSPQLDWWDDRHPDDFERAMEAYDFRGPLYRWRERGIRLTYEGAATVNGHRLTAVRAEESGHYPRHYFFEPGSGLMVLITEEDELERDAKTTLFTTPPIDFKFIHEYLPVRESLVPSEESFQRDGLFTIERTTARLLPRDNLLFNRD